MTLKAKQIEHAKVGMHADGGGLYLRVQASGALLRFVQKHPSRERVGATQVPMNPFRMNPFRMNPVQ